MASAVVWIDGRRARIARLEDADRLVTNTVERGDDPELSYLSAVVRAIGDCQRVMILGPGSARLALEREYVDVHRRPDHLVDVERVGRLDEPDLIEQLRRLAG